MTIYFARKSKSGYLYLWAN